MGFALPPASRPPQDKVWRALTEDETWPVGSPPRSKASGQPGAPLRFSFRNAEARPFDGEMLVFDPPACMELRWGDDCCVSSSSPTGPGACCRMTVTFPEYGKAARDAAGLARLPRAAGLRLRRRAAAVAATRPLAFVHARYVVRLGPEASTIGPPEECGASTARRRRRPHRRSARGDPEREVQQPAEGEARAPVRPRHR